MKNKFILFSLIAGSLVFTSCSENKNQNKPSKPLFELTTTDSVPSFDAAEAYQMVEEQVKFGPRNPGSKAHKKALGFYKNEFGEYADKVELQPFSYPGYDNERLELTNIIAKFNPYAKNRIVICAHWDSRPRAEHAKDPANVNLPIMGANDGASGCGILIELAKILHQNKISYGIDLVLFDGEDYGKSNDLNNFCLGSKYYAAKLNGDYPAFAILLDMVGDKEAVFTKELNSLQFAPEITEMIWNTAYQVNAGVFSQAKGSSVYDDHIPLNQVGLRTVDIIDADLIGADSPNERRNYWHSDEDTMKNISQETLRQVGDVLTTFIYSLKFNG